MGYLVNPYVYAGFQPTDIPGLVLWLDANDASTISLSGSDVTTWNDKSGNGNHVSQSSASLKPAYTPTGTSEGLGAIRFTDEFLSRTDALGFTGNPAMSVMFFGFVQASPLGGPGAESIIYLGDNSAASAGKNIYFTTDSAGYAARYNNGNVVFNAVDNTQRTMLLWRRNASATYNQVQFYENGGTAESVTASTNPTFTPALDNDITLIGARVNNGDAALVSDMNTVYFGLIVVDGVISDEDANRMAAYWESVYYDSAGLWTDI